MLTFESAYNASTIPRNLKVSAGNKVCSVFKKINHFSSVLHQMHWRKHRYGKKLQFKKLFIDIDLVFFWWIGTIC
jgi:hypothetical protein